MDSGAAMFQPLEPVFDIRPDTRSDVKMTYALDAESVKQALEDLQLGQVSVTHDLKNTINVNLPGDKFPARPTDVTVIDVEGTETIVVTDWSYNHSLKSFYMKNERLHHSRLGLSGSPWSSTQINPNQIAVSVPGAKQIVIVEVTPDLKLISIIKTSKAYFGITSLTSSTIAASSSDPPSVDILDISGNVIKSITPANNKVVLHYPRFIATTNKGNIVVSDSGGRSVLGLTPDGEVMFNFRSSEDGGLKCPHGVTVTVAGDILVCEYSKNRVLHLDESGKYVKDIMTSQDGVSHPHGVCADRLGRVYVCNHHNGDIRMSGCFGPRFTKTS